MTVFNTSFRFFSCFCSIDLTVRKYFSFIIIQNSFHYYLKYYYYCYYINYYYKLS